MSSTYYTQGQQPGPVNFSSWSETEGHEGPNGSAVSPGGGGDFNVPVNQPQPVITQPSQQFSEDPNATKLFREHFRTARDNAIPRSSGSPPSSSAQEGTTSTDNNPWYREYWYVFLIIAVVVFIAVVYYYKSRNLPTSPPGLQSSASADPTMERFNRSFGSSALNSANGILNDLEFL